MMHVANDRNEFASTYSACAGMVEDGERRSKMPILPLPALLGRVSLTVGLMCGWMWALSLVLGSNF